MGAQSGRDRAIGQLLAQTHRRGHHAVYLNEFVTYHDDVVKLPNLGCSQAPCASERKAADPGRPLTSTSSKNSLATHLAERSKKLNKEEMEYAGFWSRTGATLIDALLLMLITLPMLIGIYGWAYFDSEQTGFVAGPADFLISWVVPAIAVIVFWITKQATPGKMAIAARIVDARSGEAASTGQLVGRYLAYFVSTLPLCLGLFWVAFDRRKQGWHDKLAGTVVIRKAKRGPEPVRFN